MVVIEFVSFFKIFCFQVKCTSMEMRTRISARPWNKI